MVTMIRVGYAILGSVLGALLGPTAARACSVVQAPMPAELPSLQDVTLGPTPTLFAANDMAPTLADARTPDVPIPIERVADVPVFFDLSPQDIIAWRPVTPLAAGTYTWRGGGRDGRFFVDADWTAGPQVVGQVSLSLHLDTPDEDETFGGCGATDGECGDIDFTLLSVTLSVPSDAPERFILTLTRGNVTKSRLVQAQRNAPTQLTIGVFDRFLGMPSFKSGTVCVALRPVDDDGVLGTVIDAGCIAPDDGDPRVDDERSCASGAFEFGWVGVALAFVARSRRRRARQV